MIVACDNTFLTLIFNPDSKPTPNPKTGYPIDYCKERVDELLDRHSREGNIILVATPCLTELLTSVPDLAKVVDEITSSSAFLPASFDARSAVELAIVTQEARNNGDKKKRC